MLSTSQEVLFILLRIALGNENDFSLPNVINWTEVIQLAAEQGVSAIASDGFRGLRDANPGIELNLDQPELEELKFQWLGQSMLCEVEYERYQKTIADLACFYESQGIKMMLLKGYGLSLNYPIPAHRPFGDIDICLFDENGLPAWKMGDEVVERMLRVKVDRSHHHHTIFHFEGQMVENHYDFINTKAHRDAAAIEKKLKELAVNNTECEINGTKAYLPSATFNAIFLVRHMGQHFAAERITLRQVLDWALFLDNHSVDVDWKMVEPFLKEIGIWNFCCLINAICVDYLGFKSSCFPSLSEDKRMEEIVLKDILAPEFCETEPSEGLFRILSFKARRWWHNRWKHPLVYKEWWLPMLLTLAWSHIRKPNLGDQF